MANFSKTKLQRLRFERGLSRGALARAAGVHEWSVQAWELGRHVPRGTSVAAIARALGVRFDDLLEEQGPAAASATGHRSEDHAGAASRGVNDAAR